MTLSTSPPVTVMTNLAVSHYPHSQLTSQPSIVPSQPGYITLPQSQRDHTLQSLGPQRLTHTLTLTPTTGTHPRYPPHRTVTSTTHAPHHTDLKQSCAIAIPLPETLSSGLGSLDGSISVGHTAVSHSCSNPPNPTLTRARNHTPHFAAHPLTKHLLRRPGTSQSRQEGQLLVPRQQHRLLRRGRHPLWPVLRTVQLEAPATASAAICRTTVEMVLNECLIILLEYLDPSTLTNYVGRVDYSAGLAVRVNHLAKLKAVKDTPQATFTYPYTSCLLLAQAKHSGDVDGAMGQLCAHLAIDQVQFHGHRCRGHRSRLATSRAGGGGQREHHSSAVVLAMAILSLAVRAFTGPPYPPLAGEMEGEGAIATVEALGALTPNPCVDATTTLPTITINFTETSTSFLPTPAITTSITDTSTTFIPTFLPAITITETTTTTFIPTPAITNHHPTPRLAADGKDVHLWKEGNRLGKVHTQWSPPCLGGGCNTLYE
ncbi:hypothetical protein DFH27DRAFT_640965 [Peziza echinospora]|nr:hypothetical protein DFH27DRAFT_640965 [Peziza echinospora]